MPIARTIHWIVQSICRSRDQYIGLRGRYAVCSDGTLDSAVDIPFARTLWRVLQSICRLRGRYSGFAVDMPFAPTPQRFLRVAERFSELQGEFRRCTSDGDDDQRRDRKDRRVQTAIRRARAGFGDEDTKDTKASRRRLGTRVLRASFVI